MLCNRNRNPNPYSPLCAQGVGELLNHVCCTTLCVLCNRNPNPNPYAPLCAQGVGVLRNLAVDDKLRPIILEQRVVKLLVQLLTRRDLPDVLAESTCGALLNLAQEQEALVNTVKYGVRGRAVE